MRSVLLISLLIARIILQAQSTPVVQVNSDRIFIGASVQLQFELRAVPRTATVQWRLPDSLPHFQYVRIDSSYTMRRTIEITSWDSGAWQVEGIQAVVQNTPGSKALLLQFPAQLVRVEYDTSGPQLLNSIKPIMENETNEDNGLAFALLAAILVILMLWFYLKKKKATASVVLDHPKALATFLQTLDRLQQQSVATSNARKDLLTALSHALYNYFEQRTGIRFRQHTTDACIRQLHELLPLQQHTELLQLLRLTDAVKFARYDAGAGACTAAVQTARLLIQQMDLQLNR